MDLGSGSVAHSQSDRNNIQENHLDLNNNIQDNNESTKFGAVSDIDPNPNAFSPGNGVDEIVPKSPDGQSPPTTKGYGLKKWRRIKRPSPQKDEPAAVATDAEDSGKVLKRGLSGSTTPTKPVRFSSAEIKQNAEDFGGPLSVLKNLPSVTAVECGSSLDSRFAVGATSVAGSDSDNSEDHSSKSSTAASVPKVWQAAPSVLWYVWENSKMKNLVEKVVDNSRQRVQLGKSITESTKKHRGERIKVGKENSHSSIESNSGSSNFVFAQGIFSATSSDEKQGRTSVNYNWGNNNEAYSSEQQFSEEAAYRKEYVGEIEELSQDDLTADSSGKAREGKSENHQGSPLQDPLVYSILALHSVQESLEKEVHKLVEIGREPVSLHANSVNTINVPVDSTFTEIHEPSSSDQLASEKIGENISSSLDIEVFTLTQKAKSLESRLEEAKVVLELKDKRIAELEAAMNSSKSTKEDSGSTAEKFREMELEFEGLFQQKLETEIEYLALISAIEKLRVAAIDQRMFFQEQKSLIGGQVHVLRQLGEAENKAAVLKKETEKLEMYCGDISGTEEILKMQRRVSKFTFCFFIQLMLLVLVFWMVLSRLYPDTGVVVPT
ncbi:hypothetical protein SLE2022_400430 [Rubroshorea leprosula]